MICLRDYGGGRVDPPPDVVASMGFSCSTVFIFQFLRQHGPSNDCDFFAFVSESSLARTTGHSAIFWSVVPVFPLTMPWDEMAGTALTLPSQQSSPLRSIGAGPDVFPFHNLLEEERTAFLRGCNVTNVAPGHISALYTVDGFPTTTTGTVKFQWPEYRRPVTDWNGDADRTAAAAG